VTSLHLNLLGAPEIQVSGSTTPWQLRDQKARALLFYLAVTGRPQSRDYLATLLWSDSLESNARHSLRSCLYHLRHALQACGVAELLLVNSDHVHLNLEEDQCDITRFRQLIATKSEPALAEAVALYRGPLLEGFTLTEAPVFENWVRAEATSLGRAHHLALERLLASSESRQLWSEATEYAEKMVQLDPLDETSLQRLMRLYLQSGATGRALLQYRHFKDSLHRELGLLPSPETEELLQTVLRPQAQARLGVGSAPATPAQRDHAAAAEPPTPLVGRDDILARLLTLISEGPQVGSGVTILLQGEAGMGKTRLLDEVATRLSTSESQWIILRGSCSPFDDLLSYGPFYDAFQTAAPGDLTDMLMVERRNAPDEAGNVRWRVLQTMRLLTHGGPLLLAIDDLHWANSATLHLFGFLATRIRTLPVLLVGTIQHPEAIPAIQHLLAVGRHRGAVHLITVPPLTLEAVTAFLSALDLDADSVASLSEWLQDRSGGSPYILGEILAQLRADAVLIQDNSGWHLDAACWLRQRVMFTLPATTHDLLAWRLAPLSPQALHVLDLLAVAGRPLSLAFLHDLLGEHADLSLQIVDDLLVRGLLIEAPGECVTLPHHLLRETLHSRLSHLRRRMLHRQLLEALERYATSGASVGLRHLALHAVAGEDTERAHRYGLLVLEDLLLDQPSAETLRFLYQLRDLLAPSALPHELMKLAHALGTVHQSLGELEAATQWHERHLELARLAGDITGQAAAHFEIGELALVTNDYSAAAAAATSGLQLFDLPETSTPAGRGYRLLGAAKAMEGRDLGGAVQDLQQAVAIHRDGERFGELCADLFELGNVAAQRGELARALALYDEAAAAAAAGHAYYFLALAHNNFAYHSLLLGRADAAQQAVSQGQRVARTHELVGALLHLYSTQGEVYLYLAEWERASQCFRRGLALAEELGNLERQAGYRAGLALAARGQADFAGALKLLEEARMLITEQSYWHLHTRILLWLAETYWLSQRGQQAWAPLADALATARSQGRVLLSIQGECLHASLLARRGQQSLADKVFVDLLRQAAGLDLPLEVARIQVAYAQSGLLSMSTPDEAKRLREEARATFIALHAAADLQTISGDVPRI
jgi:DNA-binding SARP family transcriptional activator